MPYDNYIRHTSQPHQRSLAPAAQSAAMIPAPKGVQVQQPSGNTFISLQVMNASARKHYPEAQQLAKHLRKATLSGTIKNIRNWLYTNFQYREDEELQKIRTLSHAFHNERNTGIDCKSYSVIASQLLHNLGIIHYFRKIKQNKASHYSHVYVVVPHNQLSGKLSSGYYVIDAVPEYTHEAPYTHKHDTRINPAQGKGLGLTKATPGRATAIMPGEPNPTQTQNSPTPAISFNQVLTGALALGIGLYGIPKILKML